MLVQGHDAAADFWAFGALLFGSLAEFVGLRWSYAVAGALCLMTAGFLWRRRDAMNGAAEPTQ